MMEKINNKEYDGQALEQRIDEVFESIQMLIEEKKIKLKTKLQKNLEILNGSKNKFKSKLNSFISKINKFIAYLTKLQNKRLPVNVEIQDLNKKLEKCQFNIQNIKKNHLIFVSKFNKNIEAAGKVLKLQFDQPEFVGALSKTVRFSMHPSKNKPPKPEMQKRTKMDKVLEDNININNVQDQKQNKRPVFRNQTSIRNSNKSHFKHNNNIYRKNNKRFTSTQKHPNPNKIRFINNYIDMVSQNADNLLDESIDSHSSKKDQKKLKYIFSQQNLSTKERMRSRRNGEKQSYYNKLYFEKIRKSRRQKQQNLSF